MTANITHRIQSHTYLIRCPEHVEQVAEILYRQVHDPELNMTWVDADEIYEKLTAELVR